MTVVGLVESDDVVTSFSESFHIVGAIVNICMSRHIRFFSDKTNITIRNSLLVQPLGRVGDSDRMAPIHIETMSDYPNPFTCVR